MAETSSSAATTSTSPIRRSSASIAFRDPFAVRWGRSAAACRKGQGQAFSRAPGAGGFEPLSGCLDAVSRSAAAETLPGRCLRTDVGAQPLGRRLGVLSIAPISTALSALQYCDLNTYLPLDILTKVDRMAMAHSLEARPPLLDHKLVEFAARVPARFRIHNGSTKYLFKQAMRGLLPDDIIDRPKQGFAVPLASWFRGELAGFARELLCSDRSRQRGLFKTDYIERLIRLHEGGRNIDLHLWTLVSLELWCRRVLDVPLSSVRTPRASRERILPAVLV